jgi:hypothetical protein
VIEKQVAFLSGSLSVPALLRPAKLDDGILCYNEKEVDSYVGIWNAYLNRAKRDISHFVPASGQSNRFLRDLKKFLDSDVSLPRTNFEKNFFKHLRSFAFYSELNTCCLERTGLDVDHLIEAGHYKSIVRLMLSEDGLNMENLPTALFKFHVEQSHSWKKYLPKKIAKYYNSFEDIRTPLQEIMYESAMVSGVKGNTLNMCYTVQASYRDQIRDFLRIYKMPIEKKMGVAVAITLPVQPEASNTIALTENNQLLRDENGDLFLQQAGHGALLPLLNDLRGNVIFIKNIDNATPDSLKKLSVRYKKLLGGILVETQRNINKYMRLLEKEDLPDDKLIEIIYFVENILNVKHTNILRLPKEEQINYLRKKLNRPLRVCGVVTNEDEQGGVPCWVTNADGTASLQLIEYHQVVNDAEKLKIFESSTHFNPVDMVCYVNDYKGKRFDFTQFSDPEAYMVLCKEIKGEKVKVLEKPGLWNGCMADWNTVLVEVPVKTFNPVKTINDLLRHEHQNT